MNSMVDPRLENLWQRLPLDQVETIKAENLKDQEAIVILSYPDDEGVRLNRGRPGAAQGPARILHYLGRMVHRKTATPNIFILERFVAGPHDPKPSLADRHQAAERAVLNLLKEGFRVISLGGGHDYGFPDASAFLQFNEGNILNVDAHLDVRPVVNGELNSGTAFFRLIEKYGGKCLTEWGLQPQCNALEHLDFARKSGARLLSYQEKLPKLKGPVGLSICMDAFRGIRAVSAPAIVGLSPEQGIEAIRTYAPQSNWLGLYEVAPEYDPQTEDAARLAALMAYHFIHRQLKL